MPWGLWWVFDQETFLSWVNAGSYGDVDCQDVTWWVVHMLRHPGVPADCSCDFQQLTWSWRGTVAQARAVQMTIFRFGERSRVWPTAVLLTRASASSSPRPPQAARPASADRSSHIYAACRPTSTTSRSVCSHHSLNLWLYDILNIHTVYSWLFFGYVKCDLDDFNALFWGH